MVLESLSCSSNNSNNSSNNSNNSSSNNGNKSIYSYETDDSGCEKYPKKANGSEYYLYDVHKVPIFAKNCHNDEIYAQDIYLNEIYPERPPFFAKNRCQNVYYARDSEMNEIYPTYKGLDIYTFTRDGNALIARYKSGRERYPSNGKGNYYPVDITGKPFYLRDENGLIYPAKNKKNQFIYLKPPILDKRHVKKKKDALNNTVYLSHPKVENEILCCKIWLMLCSMITPLIVLAFCF